MYYGSLNKVCQDWFNDNYPFDSSIYPDTPQGEADYNRDIDNIIASISYDDAKKCWEESCLKEHGDWIIGDIYSQLKRIAERLM